MSTEPRSSKPVYTAADISGFEGAIKNPARAVSLDPDLTGRGSTLNLDGKGFQGNVVFSAYVGGVIKKVEAMSQAEVDAKVQERKDLGLAAPPLNMHPEPAAKATFKAEEYRDRATKLGAVTDFKMKT